MTSLLLNYCNLSCHSNEDPLMRRLLLGSQNVLLTLVVCYADQMDAHTHVNSGRAIGKAISCGAG